MRPTFVRVIAKLDCRDVDPATLAGRTVRLYDSDPFSDDCLASSTVEPDATAAFLFDLAASRSWDSPLETRPDLFCVVSADDGRILYRSAVHRDADFLAVDPATGEQRRTLAIDFRRV